MAAKRGTRTEAWPLNASSGWITVSPGTWLRSSCTGLGEMVLMPPSMESRSEPIDSLAAALLRRYWPPAATVGRKAAIACRTIPRASSARPFACANVRFCASSLSSA